MTPALLAFALFQDPEACRQHLLHGRVEQALTLAEGRAEPEWFLLHLEALAALGRDEGPVVEAALKKHPGHVRLLMAAHDVASRWGRADETRALLARIHQAASEAAPDAWTPSDRVALGRAALASGVDAAGVLKDYFDRARRDEPLCREAHRAGAALALDKHDEALAARWAREGLKHFPEDPDLWTLLARAFAPSDREEAAKAIEAALKQNPAHAGALLLKASLFIDQEDVAAARAALDAIAAPPPEAWAYRATLAHLDHDAAGEREARQKGLAPWDRNPRVDHLIGRTLSGKYRFAEGAACQRRALEADPGFLPARLQLAQDLLRLGDEEGWALAADVHAKDGYDIHAYNLVTLRDHVAGFETLRAEGLRVRMEPREAAVYGARMVEMLSEARRTLGERYGGVPARDTLVEIFPDPQDFAIRTFGLPGGEGFLGVCFGDVVTAKSPATPGLGAHNWESTLWHEYCHAVTLNLTKNRMPRWLSEGISVLEERRRDPACARRLTPEFRERILGDGLTPIAGLSGAFLQADELMFAYFESGWVVEYLIEKHGLERFRLVLSDLAGGSSATAAFEKRLGPMAEIEAGFAAFAKERAAAKPEEDVEDWAKRAEAHRQQGETAREREVLEKLASLDSEQPAVVARLAELAEAAGDGEAAHRNARRMIALNPMWPEAQLRLARAAEAIGRADEAIAAGRALLRLDPADPADAHFRLARLLKERDRPAARRHVLLALAEAPRFRDAHRLLLELAGGP